MFGVAGDEVIEVRLYLTPSGDCPFDQWLNSLRDRTTQARVDARIARLRSGNVGDTRPVGDGVYELRLAFGSGYRVYYGRVGSRIVILLTGGDKRRQTADIEHAKSLWRMYLREKNHAHD